MQGPRVSNWDDLVISAVDNQNWSGGISPHYPQDWMNLWGSSQGSFKHRGAGEMQNAFVPLFDTKGLAVTVNVTLRYWSEAGKSEPSHPE
jgi:hypothetical protein